MTGLRAVALGEHHASSRRPPGTGRRSVHPTGRGRAERARGVALRRLGRAGVVHAVVAQVLRHRLAGVEPLLDLGVGDVAGHDHRAGQHHARAHRVLRQLGADLGHRPVEVDVRRPSLPSRSSSVVSGRNRAGSRSSCSRNTPSAVILPSAWRSAEHDTAIATGQLAPWRGRRTMRTSWQKYLPPNWAPMPVRLGELAAPLASSSTSRKPCPSGEPVGRQRVEVVRRRQLGRLDARTRPTCRRSRRRGGTAGRRPCRASASCRRSTAAAWPR